MQIRYKLIDVISAGCVGMYITYYRIMSIHRYSPLSENFGIRANAATYEEVRLRHKCSIFDVKSILYSIRKNA